MDLAEKYSRFLPLLSAPQKRKLISFFESLNSEGQLKGFIAPANAELVFLRHIVDSLLCLSPECTDEVKQLFRPGITVSDLGSGPGLPGIPLAIALPECRFTLIDQGTNRCQFAADMAKELELENVSVREADMDGAAEKTDLVIYRAFRKPLASLELALRAAAVGSKILYWRSRKFDEIPEAATRIRDLGYSLPEYFQVAAPPELPNRGFALLTLERVPDKFPRSWARIKKDKLVESIA